MEALGKFGPYEPTSGDFELKLVNRRGASPSSRDQANKIKINKVIFKVQFVKLYSHLKPFFGTNLSIGDITPPPTIGPSHHRHTLPYLQY